MFALDEARWRQRGDEDKTISLYRVATRILIPLYIIC